LSSHFLIIEKLVNFLLPGLVQSNVPSAFELDLVEEITSGDLWNHESLVRLSMTIESNDDVHNQLKDATSLDEMVCEKVIIDFLRMNMVVILDKYLSNKLTRSSMKLSTKPPFPGGYRVDFDEDVLEELLTNVKCRGTIYKDP